MFAVLRALWIEDDGFIISSELTLISSILVFGLIVGLTQLSAEINEELGDVAAAISVINESYSFAGISGHHAVMPGSAFFDSNDGFSDGVNGVATCVVGLTPMGTAQRDGRGGNFGLAGFLDDRDRR